MKKNILLLLASASLLASCGAGNGQGAATAPEYKEAATLAEVKASAKKAGEAVAKATGVSAKFGADLKANATAEIPAGLLSDKALTLKEKVELTGVNLEEKASYKDGKVAASGSFNANLLAELDMPAMPTEEEMSAAYSKAIAENTMPSLDVKTETHKIQGGLSAKDWLVDGKLYGDASGCYDAIKGIFDAIPEQAGVEFPFKSADDLKVFVTLPEGTIPEGNPFEQIGTLFAAIDQLTEESIPEFVKLGKFSDGTLGAKVGVPSLLEAAGVKERIPEGITITGDVVVTFTEAGAFNVYADAKATIDSKIPAGQDTNVTVKGEASFKASIQLAVGDVTIDALPDVSKFKELNLGGGAKLPF